MSLTDNQMDQELRRHARVDDDIVLFWRELGPEETPEALTTEKTPASLASLSAQLSLLDLETGKLLRGIEPLHPLLAEYLKVLENKIALLARAATAREAAPLVFSTRYVNLSAAGLAFLTEVNYPLGALLELKMILPPSQAIIQAYGRVVHQIPYDQGLPRFYRVGVDFTHLKDRDRALLARHVDRRKALFPDPMQHG